MTGAYEMAYANPELFSTHVDTAAALAKMPVRLTTVEEWVREHAQAFSPVAVQKQESSSRLDVSDLQGRDPQ